MKVPEPGHTLSLCHVCVSICGVSSKSVTSKTRTCQGYHYVNLELDAPFPFTTTKPGGVEGVKVAIKRPISTTFVTAAILWDIPREKSLNYCWQLLSGQGPKNKSFYAIKVTEPHRSHLAGLLGVVENRPDTPL